MVVWKRLFVLAALVQTPLAEQAPLLPIQKWKLSRQPLPQTSSDELLSLHRKLVEIESISGNEKHVGYWLASYLKKQNLTVEMQKVEKGRFNIFAYQGKERKTKVLVTSHIDTVCL
jgi:acetylornithine deacetylase